MPDDHAQRALEYSELLQPITDVPDWCNQFLYEFLVNADTHLGSMTSAAKAAGRSYDSVWYQRGRNPEFDARVAEIYELVNYSIDDALEQLLLKLALHGITEQTTERIGVDPSDLVGENDPGVRIIKKNKLSFDPKVIQWLLERRRRQRYGPDQHGHLAAGATIQFTFKLGDRDTIPEIEGQAELIDDRPALPETTTQ